MNLLLLLSLLALGYQTASAQLVTESFGTGDNAFTMDFVTIGNPNNAADTTGNPNPAGSVAYTYNIGKYEISRDVINKANAAGSLGITMYDMSSYGGNGVNKPATGVSWYESATYVNWLNTSTGGAAAYKFVGGTFTLWSAGDAGYNASNKFRNSNAKFWLPSTDEWYKAAYGSPNGTWYDYPTGSNAQPTNVSGGTDPNTAVFDQRANNYPYYGPADITNAGGVSAYGTMGQGGNIRDWIETAVDGINDTANEDRYLRGGGWDQLVSLINTSYNYASPWDESFSFGFRVVMIPEPSSLSLLVLGGAVVALCRRKRALSRLVWEGA